MFNAFKFERVEFQTFETMLNESIDVMDEKQKLYNDLKESFKGKIFICFTIPDGMFLAKTVVEMQKTLFDCFSIKDPKISLLAFETENVPKDVDIVRRTKIIEFFNKIYAKLQNPNLKIEEIISPYSSFGIKFEVNEKNPNRNIASKITKDYIFDFKIYQESNDRIECKDKDFRFTKTNLIQFLSFNSNFNLSKIDFEFCKKFYIKNIAKIIETDHIGFLVIKVGKNNLEIYKNIFNNLCNKTKEINNCDTFKFQFLQCFVMSESKALSTSDKSLPVSLSYSLQIKHANSEQIVSNQIKMSNEIQKKNYKLNLESLYIDFYIDTLLEASKEAKNIIKDYLPLGIINEIYHLKLNWLFGDQNIYFYKVSEDYKIINCQDIKKITVLAIAEHINCQKIFDFFYFEKIDGTITQDYKFESNIKSQQNLKNFFRNLNQFLKIFTFEKIYCDFNIFYFLLQETNLHFIEKINFKLLKFHETDFIYTDFIKYIFDLFKRHPYNETLLRTYFLHSYNFKELVYLNTNCIYQNIPRNVVNIETKKFSLDKNFCYKIELKLKENEIFILDIIPHISFEKFELYLQKFVTKSKIKNLFKKFIEQNKKCLSKNLHMKLKYEDSKRVKFYNNRQEFYDLINDETMFELMNKIIDEINISELINIFEKSFLGYDKISERSIDEFMTNSPLSYENIVCERFKTNMKDIKNEPLIFKKAYAFQNIFLFILDQTRYEIIFNSIKTQKDFDIIVSWNQHYNFRQNLDRIFSILINTDFICSDYPFAFLIHKKLEFI
ncbi:hypothetical protein GVAV_003216 [Gurleya vavrai]